MAISGKFEADFNSFYDASQKAQTSLRGFEQAADKVGTSIDQMVGKGFDIEKALANPMAAAKEAAFALADSLGGAALAAAASVASLAAVGAALFKLASDAAAVGAGLDDMADKTGLSVPALSRLQNAAAVVGADMGQLTNAIFTLEKGMGKNTEQFRNGLQQMGLSTAELKAAGPDRYLELITAGLNGIAEPSTRAAAGNAVLGLSYKNLAATLIDLQAGFDATNDIQPWTAEQAADAERFEQQMSSLVVHAEALATSFGRDLIGPISAFVGGIVAAAKGISDYIDLSGGALPMIRRLGEAWNFAAAAIDVFRGKTVALGTTAASTAEKLKTLKDAAFDAAHSPDAGVTKWKDSIAALTPKVNDLTAALALDKSVSKDLALHHVAHTKIVQELDSAYADVLAPLKSTVLQVTQLGGAMQGAMPQIEAMRVGITGIEKETGLLSATLIDSGTATFTFADQAAAAAEQTAQFRKELEKGPDTLREWDHDLQELADGFARLAQISGTSFGGIVKGIAQVIGVMDLAAKSAEIFQKGFSAKNWAQTTTGIIGMAGAFEQATASTSRWSATMGGAATGAAIGGKIFPVVGTWIGAAAGALVGWIRSAGAAERAINPLREQFVQMAGGLAALNVQAVAAGTSLTAMLNAKNAEQYKAAIDALTGAMQFQDDAMQVLDETIQKYGFSIDELGPKWAAQKLNDQAASLLKDYQVLTAAGVDHNAILAKMGPTLQTYVTTALKAGVAIPEAMRPALQGMVDLGLLTDESGEALTDLTKLTFAETLDKKFSTLIDTIQKLADAITRGVGGALAALPTEKTIHVGFQYDDFNPPSREADAFASMGGLVTANGVQYLAGGGNVLRFKPRGSDTVPAMLTPGEGIVSRRGMATLGKGGLSALNSGAGGGGDTAAVVSAIDALRSDLADLHRLLPKMIRDKLRGAA